MGPRSSKRKGVTAYLLDDDRARLKRIAALFPTEQGKPNQTRAIEKALKLFEKSIMEGKNDKHV